MGVTGKTRAIIADEVFGMFSRPHEVPPYSERFPGFDLNDAYVVVNEIRRRREDQGERVVGRKIGFTNAAAWAGYGISGPIWNYLYDTTTLDLPLPGVASRSAPGRTSAWRRRSRSGFARCPTRT